MTSGFVALRQHTDQEWEDVRPIIERLYVEELRPLSAVMQAMMTEHQFRASVAMFKRRLRVWGIYKNKRRSRAPPATAGSQRRRGSGPRYLCQDDFNESIHTLLDLLAPWIAQAGLPQFRNARVYCPARAAYIYDGFTTNIAVAATAFESGNLERGWEVIGRAFLDLEHTLTPELRSMFTLHSVFFALATLNMAGLFEISRMLLAHAIKLVVTRTRADGPVTHNPVVQHSLNEEIGEEGMESAYKGSNANHPFPQILGRLQVLRHKANNTVMTEAILRTWSAYYDNTRRAVGMSMVTQCSRKEYWQSAIGTHRCPSYADYGEQPWSERIQPVIHYLGRLENHPESLTDAGIRNLSRDEIISVYSFMRHEDFEAMALQRVAKAGPGELRWNASLELAAYYQRTGDKDKALNYLASLVPESMGHGWRTLLNDVLEEWEENYQPGAVSEKTRYPSPS